MQTFCETFSQKSKLYIIIHHNSSKLLKSIVNMNIFHCNYSKHRNMENEKKLAICSFFLLYVFYKRKKITVYDCMNMKTTER